MIVYDENLNILGMGKKALGFLEFSSLADFLQNHNDIGEFIMGFDANSQNIIKYILSLPSRSKKVHLRSRSGKVSTVILNVNEIYSKTEKKLYELEIRLEDRIFDDDIHRCESPKLATLRLPMIFEQNDNKNTKTTQVQDIMINAKWLKQANSRLNLSKDEFIGYLKIFIQSSNKIDISLQNFLVTRDYKMVKKIIAKLKEPAANLHITPLVQIYDALLSSNATSYADLLATSRECINALTNLLQQTDEK